jgi:hypothetical protein
MFAKPAGALSSYCCASTAVPGENVRQPWGESSIPAGLHPLVNEPEQGESYHPILFSEYSVLPSLRGVRYQVGWRVSRAGDRGLDLHFMTKTIAGNGLKLYKCCVRWWSVRVVGHRLIPRTSSAPVGFASAQINGQNRSMTLLFIWQLSSR